MIIVSGWPRPRTDAPVGPGVLWIRDGEMVEAYAVLIGSFSLDELRSDAVRFEGVEISRACEGWFESLAERSH